MIKSILFALALVGCGGMAVDYMPDGGVDGTTNPEYESEKVSDTEEKWCIGCLAGVSIPRSLPFGYGLRPITETIGGKLTQFPACQGTHTSMPHACRFPIGNKFWFGPPPTAWSAGRKEMYRQTVVTVGAQLSASGITWGSAQISGGTCPWDNANDRYKHTEILTKPDITNSPHPLFRLTLQGINNTTNGNLKGYLACEIEFDHLGPLGIGNNGGNCTGNCANNWEPDTFAELRRAAFTRALSRCVGLGGDQLPIYEWDIGEGSWANCWAEDGYSCAWGGGDGMLRKEWLPAGWWSQVYWKSCLGSTSTSCVGAFPSGGPQFLSGQELLSAYLH
jgi:hypothetical protein